MEKECFVFLSDENKYGSMYPVILADAMKKDNVYFLERTFKATGKLFTMLKNILFSTVLNIKLREIPCSITQKILSEQYMLKDEVQNKCREYDKVHIVFFNASIKRYYSDKILEDIKNISNKVCFYMFFLDPSTIFASGSALNLISNNSDLFDRIFTVDKKDSEDRGWKYMPTPYSKVLECTEAENDIYFCGATKNRHNLLIDLIKCFNINNIKYCMDVFYIKKKEKNLDKLLKVMDIQSIANMKTYKETLYEMSNSSCILEIITKGQSATFTLRCYEAVVYNKKLLTNNKKIFEFPYYDSRYMKYFSDIEDIDIEWIKSDIKVDYHYKGDYSPLKLLKEIQNG